MCTWVAAVDLGLHELQWGRGGRIGPIQKKEHVEHPPVTLVFTSKKSRLLNFKLLSPEMSVVTSLSAEIFFYLRSLGLAIILCQFSIASRSGSSHRCNTG